MIDWKFKGNLCPVGSSDGFWYDITYSGYIVPEELLDDKEQLKELNNAIKIIQSFEEALTENDLLNEF